MARLTLITAPETLDTERRFGLLVDQAADLSDQDRKQIRNLAGKLGAAACVVVDGTVDTDTGSGRQVLLFNEPEPEPAPEAEATATLSPQVMLSPRDLIEAALGGNRLPPVNTVEGRAARVMGGNR